MSLSQNQNNAEIRGVIFVTEVRENDFWDELIGKKLRVYIYQIPHPNTRSNTTNKLIEIEKEFY